MDPEGFMHFLTLEPGPEWGGGFPYVGLGEGRWPYGAGKPSPEGRRAPGAL